MDAIVLVGGQGTRLRPLTATRHKSLVPLCNRPAIEYLFDWLQRSGFSRIVLAIGQHNEDLIAAYPPGQYGGMALAHVHETERLESGGAIRNAVASAKISERFAVLNGDIFVEFDFAPALEQHIERAADLTLALHEEADPSQFGVAVLDDSGMVMGFIEKPPLGAAPGNLVNAGVWIFEHNLVDEIPAGAVRVEETLFPSLVARRRPVLGYAFTGLWADIGTRTRYLAINRAMIEGGRNGIAPSATIDPASTVSESSVGDLSTIGPRAIVERSLLWERVQVGMRAEVRDSIVADGVVIGAGARLTETTVGSGATIAPGAVLLPGTSVGVGARYDGPHER